MKKQNLLKLLILVMAVLGGTVEAFATATAVQTFSMSAQPTVAITKSSSAEAGTIDPANNGYHGGLNASFELTTNGTDSDYTFIVGSKITSRGGLEVSAFSDDGKALLFGRCDNEESMPTTEAISNAKAGGGDNPNVISYPITEMFITSPMSIKYEPAQENTEGNMGCYVIMLNGAQSGTLNQQIGGSPVGRTFSTSQDSAGSYRAVVYFTALPK